MNCFVLVDSQVLNIGENILLEQIERNIKGKSKFLLLFKLNCFFYLAKLHSGLYSSEINIFTISL